MDSKNTLNLFRGTSVNPVSRDFFQRSTHDVARELLGKQLVFWSDQGPLAARILETEAYHESEPAAHSHRGRTARNAVMFGAAGHAYIYFIYGMYYCLNVVTEAEDIGCAVLIRAVTPTYGEEIMRGNRQNAPANQRYNGPAKVVQAFGLGPASNGMDLCQSGSRLSIWDDGFVPEHIVAGPRVGISKAMALPWRFWIEDLGDRATRSVP